MFKGHFKRGSVTGTGAAINVECGFLPSYVKLLNVTGLATLEWSADFTDAYGLKTVTDGTISYITSLGITPYAGVAGTTGKGFTIGADTDVNVTAEVIKFIAFGEE